MAVLGFVKRWWFGLGNGAVLDVFFVGLIVAVADEEVEVVLSIVELLARPVEEGILWEARVVFVEPDAKEFLIHVIIFINLLIS